MRRGAAVAALVTAGALLGAGGAEASSGGLVAHERSDADGKQRLSAAAIDRAEPLEALRRPLPQASGAAAPDNSVGRPGHVDGRPPRGQSAAPVATAAAAASKASFGPFVSQQVDDPTAYPNSSNGRLVGSFRGIGVFSCSASVVHARNRSVIFTAGHCVYDPPTGTWASKLTFVPAYGEGAQPFGRWSWKAIYTTRRWVRRQSNNYDYAAIALRKSRGRKVENTVGSLGFAYNVRRKQTYRAVGYPANRGDAELMWECISRYGGGDPFYRPPGPNPIGMSCDMLEGASGGSWTIARDRVASVTSFGFINRPNQLYGPRFTKKADRLRRKVGRL